MQRALQSTPVTISETWTEDGVVVDPGTVTVTVTSDDGTTVFTGSGTGTGAAARSITLNSTQTAALDLLTATWVSGSKGTLTSQVEIVGGFMFSIADMQAVLTGLSVTKTVDEITAARSLAEEALEDACGVAFVPRYNREVIYGTGDQGIRLYWPRLRAIRSVITEDGTLTSSELADLRATAQGILYFGRALRITDWSPRWPYGQVTIRYEHGHDRPPLRGSQACLTLAKNWLVKGPLDDRMTSLSTADGVFSLLTPGIRGSVTGIPEVDAFIQQYNLNTLVA